MVKEIGAGADLNDPKVKIATVHKIADKLHPDYPKLSDDNMYSAVTRQVEKALKRAAHNDGAPPDTAERKVGGGKVKIRSPPKQDEPAGDTREEPPTEPVKPAPPKLSDVYKEHAGNEEELKETMEYQWLQSQVKMLVAFIEGAYKKIGILEEADSLVPKEQQEMMYHTTIIMCMKYDWNVPERLEKALFISAWGMLLIMPPLAKFGVLEAIKNGTLGKKKKDDKKSEEPLTKTEKKV